MTNYIFAYHGGKKPETEEEGAKEMALWTKWFDEMGSAVVDGGNPVGMSKTVTSSGVADDGGPNPLSGYTIVSAKDIDEAVDMARKCPMVADGSGSVEVAPVMQM